MLADYLTNKLDFFNKDIVSEYEDAFAKKAGTRHAFAFSAGRMGLYSILEALDIGPGDEVIVPAFTCVVVPNAILYRGAKPVYVDVDPKTFNIDVSGVEKVITNKTRALCAQHTFGLICDIDELKALGAKHKITVIEDSAHALGASWKEQSVGSLSEVAFFSTDHSKVISTLYGGMVTTNDDSLAERIKVIRDGSPFLSERQLKKICLTFLFGFPLFRPNLYWLGWSLYRVAYKLGFTFRFDDELKTNKPDGYPFPAKLSAFQAKLGLSQLQNLDQNLKHRRRLGLELEKRFHWLGEKAPEDKSNHSFLRYSFLVKDRKKFVNHLRLNFELGIWFESIAHGRKSKLDKIGYRIGSCPIAEKVVRHIVNLPTHESIDIEFLLKKLDKFNDKICDNLKF
ncbi:MAG: aminotransferase class I/II-fold pyridoxal phosphate-dependent enzyme [Nitrospina sp.]|nr:aminotransferase class I/II-fold pyridoxal phosphate-dependent enzyme [Nitrospina sp.]